MGQVKAQPQTSFDDERIDDPDIEKLLEKRHRLKGIKGKALKDFTEKDKAAKSRIADLELPVGVTARCGRFIISRSTVEARSVAFEAEPTIRINIKPAKDGES